MFQDAPVLVDLYIANGISLIHFKLNF